MLYNTSLILLKLYYNYFTLYIASFLDIIIYKESASYYVLIFMLYNLRQKELLML